MLLSFNVCCSKREPHCDLEIQKLNWNSPIKIGMCQFSCGCLSPFLSLSVYHNAMSHTRWNSPCCAINKVRLSHGVKFLLHGTSSNVADSVRCIWMWVFETCNPSHCVIFCLLAIKYFFNDIYSTQNVAGSKYTEICITAVDKVDKFSQFASVTFVSFSGFFYCRTIFRLLLKILAAAQRVRG